MDMLIKDIGNKPKECKACMRICTALNEDVEKKDLLGSLRIDCKENPYECPLVLIPEHGNIVDGDKVLEALERILGEGKEYNELRLKLIKEVPVLAEASE